MMTAGDETKTAQSSGVIRIHSLTGSVINLHVVVANIRQNVLSTIQLQDMGYTTHFDRRSVSVCNRDDNVVMFGKKPERLWFLNTPIYTPSVFSVDILRWHHVLGHPNMDALKLLLNGSNNLEGVRYTENKKIEFCEGCLKGKMTNAVIPKVSMNNTFIAKQAGEKLHLDSVGPITPRGVHGEKGFLLITDDFSRYKTVLFYKKKSDLPVLLIAKLKEILNVHRKNICVLHSDMGTEILTNEVKEFTSS